MKIKNILLILVLITGLFINGKNTARAENTAELKRIQKLIELLGDEDWETRENATNDLINIGDGALEPVKGILTHPDPEVRLRAKLIFKTIKWGVSPELRNKIGNVMNDFEEGTTEVKQQIINQLIQYGVSAAPIYFKILLYESDETVKQQVYSLLYTYLNDAEFLKKLLSASTDSSDYWINRLMGDSFQRTADYTEAIKYYEKAFKVKPADTNLVPILDSAYSQGKQWEKGIALYENLIKQGNKQASYYIRLGVMYHKAANKDKAKSIFDDILSTQKATADDILSISRFYEAQGNLAEAVEFYKKGAGTFPEDINLLNGLTMCYMMQEDYDSAIPAFEKLLNKAPPLPNQFILVVFENLGECYYQKNDLQKAKDTWWRMVDTQEPQLMYFQQLINVLENHDLTEEIIKAYQLAFKSFPDDSDFKIELAKTHYRQQDYKTALETLLTAYQGTAPHLEIIFETFMNTMLFNDQTGTIAKDLLEKHVSENQNSIFPKLLLANTMENQGKKDKALEILNGLLDGNNEFSEFEYRKTGLLLYRLKSYDTAISLYNKMLSFYQNKNNDCTEVYEALGQCYYAKGDAANAQKTWLKITAENKAQDLAACLSQGRIFLAHKMFPDAQQSYETALKLTKEPEQLRGIYYCLVKTSLAGKNIDEAIKYFCAAKETAVKDADYDIMGDYLIDMSLPDPVTTANDRDKLIDGIMTKIEQDVNKLKEKDKANILLLLSRFYQAQEKTKESAESIKEAIKLLPDNKDIRYRLGFIYYYSGAFDDAEKTYRELGEKEPSNPLPLYLLGETYKQKNQKQKSADIINKAQNISSSYPESDHLNWGSYLKQIGFNETALYELNQIIQMPPQNSINDANAYELLGNLMLKDNNFEQALKYILKERKIISDRNIILMYDMDRFFSKGYHTLSQYQKTDFINSYIEYLKGKSYYQSNKTAEGKKCLENALEIHPGNFAVVNGLIELAEQNKFPAQELKKLSAGVIKYNEIQLEQNPSDSYHYYALAETYRLFTDKTDEALDLINKALLLEPGVLDYYYTLAEIYLKKNDVKSAGKIARTLLNLRPNQETYRKLTEKTKDK
ncbi:MAG: tetratricopeptide repeat protein [Planctomycetes bacterium]|nr:tetratricopeptide repeat protein [Planctomycetota bacterium]